MLTRPSLQLRRAASILAAVAVIVCVRWERQCALADSPTAPNIVLILADDLGYGDVQCYNRQRGRIPTPQIDRLASQGMRFTDGHSSSAVCSPSRYALLTGRYHWRTRLQSGIVGVFGAPLIAPDRLTIARLLAHHGYRTACVGKWHLGWDWPIPPQSLATFQTTPKNMDDEARPSHQQRELWKQVFSQPIPGGPTTRGFGSYFGTDVPNWPPYCFLENDRTVGIPSEFLPRRLLSQTLASLQGPALPDWKLEPILPALADRACQFISQSARRKEPFFLYLPLTSPHTPLAVNNAWKGKSGLGRYGDFVMETDDAVGRVLAALDSGGVADRTLVIFTSDNGCAPHVIDHLQEQGHFPSGPLRGCKSDIWEGGHRVPLVVRWPGVVKPASSSGQLVHHADVLATCAEIIAAPLPNGAAEDSFSLLPLLKGNDRPVRPAAVNQSAGGLLAIRKGPWKLVFGRGSGGWGNGQDEHPLQLYNLADDLGETHNVYAEKPQVVAELTALMDEIVRDGRSTPGPAQRNDVPVLWKRFMADGAGRTADAATR